MSGESQKTILLVEDEILIAMSEKMALEKYRYSVITANSGEKAIETIKKIPEINLILMDIDLGKGIDGTQAAEIILRDRNIPVVFLSSHIEPEIVEKTEKITSYGYVVKNSSTTALDASIKMAFKLFESNLKIQNELVERKRLESALEKRIVALTHPLDQSGDLTFKDLFDVTTIQLLQDEFSNATGVASIITLPDGTPITKPSNFTYFCEEIIQKNAKGCSNCYKSHAVLGRLNAEGPIIEPCLGGGLWNAGACISAGDQHIANWLMGQIRDETQSEETIQNYAREIGVDEEATLKAFREVPSLPSEKFKNIAQALFALTNQLSSIAYQNVQQARFIYERNQSLEKLRESEESLSITLQSIGDAVIATDINGNITRMNSKAEQLIGWSFDEAKNQKLDNIFKIINAHTRNPVANPVAMVLEKGKVIDLANHTILISRDGTEYQIADSSAPIKDKQGNIKGVILVFSDITERYEAERLLHESYIDLKNSQSIAHIGSWKLDLKTNRFTASEEGLKIFGFPQNSSPTFSEVVACMPAKDRQHASEVLKNALLTGEPYTIEMHIIRKNDGKNRIIVSDAVILSGEDGKPRAILGTNQDITERRQAEEALQESEEKYRSLTESIQDVIWILDTQTLRFRYVSPSVLKLRGFSPEEIMDQPVDAALTALEAAGLKTLIQQRVDDYLSGKKPPDTFYINDIEQPCKDGSTVWTEVVTKYYTSKETGAVEILGVTRNINDRKRLEDEVHRNESRLKILIDILQHQSASIQDFLDYALEQALQLTASKLGYIYHYHEDRKKFVLNTWSKDVMEECAIINPQTCYELDKTGIWGEAVRQRRPIIINDFQSAHPLKKGYPKGHVNLNKFLTIPVFMDSSIVGVVGLANKDTDYDETDVLQISLLMNSVWKVIERKQAEEKIKGLLSEKELLLKEVHHRIKNNMNTIHSLLILQAQTLEDPSAIAALEDAGNRVYSMMMLYDKLYQSADFSELSVKEYLSPLVDEIIANFPNRNLVKVEKTINEFNLDAKRLQILGIIINELLTNIMKYAFVNTSDGIIRVSASLGDSKVSITIQDNGPGMPESIDFQKSAGFGLMLVAILIQQLYGAIQIERVNGTKITMEFDL